MVWHFFISKTVNLNVLERRKINKSFFRGSAAHFSRWKNISIILLCHYIQIANCNKYLHRSRLIGDLWLYIWYKYRRLILILNYTLPVNLRLRQLFLNINSNQFSMLSFHLKIFDLHQSYHSRWKHEPNLSGALQILLLENRCNDRRNTKCTNPQNTSKMQDTTQNLYGHNDLK